MGDTALLLMLDEAKDRLTEALDREGPVETDVVSALTIARDQITAAMDLIEEFHDGR